MDFSASSTSAASAIAIVREAGTINPDIGDY
jgi:hypothetical protein